MVMFDLLISTILKMIVDQHEGKNGVYYYWEIIYGNSVGFYIVVSSKGSIFRLDKYQFLVYFCVITL